MYSVFNYGQMLTDTVRMSAYTQALQRALRTGATVLDIGTGTGFFTLLACKLGARRVYAIEPDNAIQVARQIAATSEYAERITFFQALSTAVTLPEQVDVMISDLRGVLPLFQQHIPAIVDARQRLLAPDGIQIPHSDTLWVAVAEAPELFMEYTAPWEDRLDGLDMSVARQSVLNVWRKARLMPQQLFTKPRAWATLDYTSLTSPHVTGNVEWTVDRAGVAHGLCAWFDATLAVGIHFSNAPGAPEAIYGQVFFPWLEPVSLAVGDTVAVTLHAHLVNDDYVWRWDTQVWPHDNPRQAKAHFTQSTFFGVPLTPQQLRKLQANYRPQLTEAGEIDRDILSLMDGKFSQEEIASQMRSRFPAHFNSPQDALSRVCQLSEKYST